MELVLAGLTYDICLIYLDDILVFSRTFEEHCQRLAQVFERLERQTLRLKASKCHLFQPKVAFLGHVISEAGIECDPDKTASISSWPRPKTLKDVRTFCGLASYYRAFVPGFAKIAQPLHNLTRKNAAFLWTDACEQAFQELKARLTKPPVLVAPNDEGQYVLDTDASDFALGAVLQQYQPDGTLRVIAYGSRALTAPERRYCITRKELLGVVFGLKKYRQHLLGRGILVRTDHAALTYLKRTPEPIGQQGRWLDLIAEFDITKIEHRPGRVHSNSDALSRRPCERDEEEPCQQCLHGTTVGRALSRLTENDSDETDRDPDYLPDESVDSQSEVDSEDEYIEERARQARGRPVSPAEPGEGAMVPETTVKKNPWMMEPHIGRLLQAPRRCRDHHWTAPARDGPRLWTQLSHRMRGQSLEFLAGLR